MHLGSEFSRCLPDLRRFARALCGSQAEGDDLVVLVLERLTTSAVTTNELAPRCALFAVLIELYFSPFAENQSRHVAHASAVPKCQHEALEVVDHPTFISRSRAAFLLMSMMDFTASETAEILNVRPHDLAKLLDTAYRELAAEQPANIFVIEDEFFIAMDLEAIVTDLGHTVAGLARTRSEALEAIQNLSIDLILADIQLADGSSGIDTVHDLLARHTVPVIFVTAYPERLLTGLRPEPTYLISKPFRRLAIQSTVSQALMNWRDARQSLPKSVAI